LSSQSEAFKPAPRMVCMKTARFFWIALSIFLTLGGAHILLDSIHHSGQYAEEFILLGGTLSALGLVPMNLALKPLLHRRAPPGRMRSGAHLTG
jgi:hypothetical protein